MKNFEIAPNLHWLEIASPDTGQGALHLDLLRAWTGLRLRLNKGVVIHSGFRSLEYNRAVGGRPRSQHLIGRALDISCRGVDFESEDMRRLLLECGFTGIGLGMGITHLDTRDAPHYFWNYLPGGRTARDEKMFDLDSERMADDS